MQNSDLTARQVVKQTDKWLCYYRAVPDIPSGLLEFKQMQTKPTRRTTRAAAAPAAEGAAVPAVAVAAMAVPVVEFIATATSGNPWTPPTVDNSQSNVQPVLPEFNPNIGISTHKPTAPTGEAVAPHGETEAFRNGRRMFTADLDVWEITRWAREQRIAPRAQAEGETPEAFALYLEKFSPDEEKFEEFKRGYARAFCDREGRTVHYIQLDEAGAVRPATAEEIAAMGTDAQDARLFTVESWAAYELSDHKFGSLKGDRNNRATVKGAWYAERNRVQNTADKRMSRLQSDAIVADTFGVKPKGARGSNNKPHESHHAAMEKIAGSVMRVDRATAIWYKAEMAKIEVALQMRLAAFYA